MDSHSYTSSSSSSSCESYPFAVYRREENRLKPLRPASYLSSLHAVRRVPRYVTKKLPIAPMPPTPPKIYKVLPADFKEAVQMLTAEPGFQSNSRCLQDVVQPPLDVVPPKTVLPESACDDEDDNNNASEWRQLLTLSSDVQVSDVLWSDQDIVIETSEESNTEFLSSPADVFSWFNGPAVGFAPLSPSSLAWWASVLPSPGTLPPPPQFEAGAFLL